MNPLTEIPGVGKSIAKDLNAIGIFRVSDLQGKNPQELYKQICKKQEMTVDRCMLYVMRCAVYYASETHHKKELLKWWNWKDRTL